MSVKCECCGARVRQKWLAKTGGEELCKTCYTQGVVCVECGVRVLRRQTVTIKGKTLCRECMLKDELPLEVTLVRSSWAPWDEEPVHSKRELLHRELFPKKETPCAT